MIRLCVLSISTFFLVGLRAQTTLSFCTSVEKDGYCVFYNTKFITSPDSSTGRIYMLLRNPSGIGQRLVNYQIFTVDKDGAETIVNKIEQSMEPEWIYAWQTSNFQSPGKYRVKVFNDAKQLICNKSFELYNVW